MVSSGLTPAVVFSGGQLNEFMNWRQTVPAGRVCQVVEAGTPQDLQKQWIGHSSLRPAIDLRRQVER